MDRRSFVVGTLATVAAGPVTAHPIVWTSTTWEGRLYTVGTINDGPHGMWVAFFTENDTPEYRVKQEAFMRRSQVDNFASVGGPWPQI